MGMGMEAPLEPGEDVVLRRRVRLVRDGRRHQLEDLAVPMNSRVCSGVARAQGLSAGICVACAVSARSLASNSASFSTMVVVISAIGVPISSKGIVPASPPGTKSCPWLRNSSRIAIIRSRGKAPK